jgi:hypothetical protein
VIAMEFNINPDRKRDIVDALIEATLNDIYRYALSLNIVPETLSTDWEPPEGHDYNEFEIGMLKKSLSRLSVLQERRNSL